MPLVTSIADEILALDLGRVITRGTPKDVVNHPKVVESYLGTTEAVIARSGAVGRKRKQKAQVKRGPAAAKKPARKKAARRKPTRPRARS
jgi:ABC-type glutathione transport system ATPase component